MSEKNKRDPVEESSWEVLQARKLSTDPSKLTQFWDARWKEQYADILDEVPEFGRHGVIAECLNRLVESGSILDVGCGTGIIAQLIDRNSMSYIGIDISEIPLGKARLHPKRNWAQFIQVPVEEYNPNAKFEAIVLNEVLYYLNQDVTLHRFKEWLKNPGILIISAFDFPEGREALEKSAAKLKVLAELNIENKIQKLRWNILVGQ